MKQMILIMIVRKKRTVQIIATIEESQQLEEVGLTLDKIKGKEEVDSNENGDTDT